MHIRFLSCVRIPTPGIRLFYVDRNWALKSSLIAVRQFNPTADMLDDNRLSALLEKYLKSVLEEFELDVSLLFSATTDSGSDVKRLCNVLLPGLWEWCICHMLNVALVEVRLRLVFKAQKNNYRKIPLCHQIVGIVSVVVLA